MAPLWHAVLAVLVTRATAQYQWPVNSTCFWRDARGGVVHDTLYLEGGLQGNMINQAAGSILTQAAGLVKFNFSSSFNESSDFTSIFQPAPFFTDPYQKPHVNGFMFVDEDEWYTFGGRAYPSYSNLTQDSTVNRDALYPPNSAAINAALGISHNVQLNLQGDETVFITNGAGVSVPSESLSFYLGGLRTNTSGHINWNAQVNTSTYPSTPMKSMIRADTSSFGMANFTTLPLPDSVSTRADAILTWIPVGTRGSLVLIGGVQFGLALANCNLNGSMVTANTQNGPGYMQTVSIYDIANDAWFSQRTNGDQPPQLAQGCAVVASNNDSSIHNIYVYGGYDGSGSSSYYDDVWILSIPAFTWIKVPSTDSSHGRFGHVCAKPYPDQMMVVGGTTKCNTILQTKMFADVYNLSSLTWTKSYNPRTWSQYVVPSAVSNAIKASPSAFMTQNLAALFRVKYAVTPKTYYPYPVTDDTPPAPTQSSPPNPSPRPGWLIPVAVVIPVVALIIAGLLLWFCIRKRRNQNREQGSRSHKNTSKWVDDQTPPDRSVRSDDEMTQVNSMYGIHEAMGDNIADKTMPRSAANELHSDSNPNTPLASPFTPTHHPGSPSSHGEAELYAPPVRHELPVEPQKSFFGNANIKNHPMYPVSVGGHGSTIDGSVSSPTAAPITPYELPQNRSRENVLPQPPNDNLLGQSRAPVPPKPLSPYLKPTHNFGDDYPDLSVGGVSPEQHPVDTPSTPPHQPITTAKSGHTRNASSLSSGLPDLTSPSPREDHRRSAHISALPDHDESDIASGSVSPAEQSAISPGSPTQVTGLGDRKEIKRKELRNWPRTSGNSIFKEEDDLGQNGRGTL